MPIALLSKAPWLRSMLSDRWISLMWTGAYAGQGWIIFEQGEDLESWLRWQVSPEVLGDPSDWGQSYVQLREHGRAVAKLLRRVGRSEASTRYLDAVRAWLRELERLMDGSTLAARHRVFNYEEIVADRYLLQWHAESSDRAQSFIDPSDPESFVAFEEFLIRHYGEPTTWSR